MSKCIFLIVTFPVNQLFYKGCGVEGEEGEERFPALLARSENRSTAHLKEKKEDPSLNAKENMPETEVYSNIFLERKLFIFSWSKDFWGYIL